MSTPNRGSGPTPRSHRPRALPVFAAAFLAGAAAAVGLNRTLEVHLAQAKPQIEQEPIFVALRPLPQGSPVTVWDVALRDWPKAMLPSTAMRATDSFDGLVVRYPLREGQPVLSVQLARASAAPAGVYAAQTPQAVAPTAAVPVQQEPPAVMPQPDLVDPARPAAATDLWTPAEQAAAEPAAQPADRPGSDRLSPPATQPPTTPAPAATVAATPAAAAPATTAPTSTDIDVPAAGDARPTAAAKQKDPVVRYLVVPEHIAAQADRSFVTPLQPPEAAKPAARTATPPTAAPTRTATARTGSAKGSPARTATMQPPAANGGVAKPAQSSTRPQAGRGKAAAPQTQQRPRQTPNQPAGQAAQTGSRADAMFPNLAAGIDAVELELRRIRRERGRLSEESEASTRTPAAATQPQAATPARSAATPPGRSVSQPQR
jgi:hypothetical protein